MKLQTPIRWVDAARVVAAVVLTAAPLAAAQDILPGIDAFEIVVGPGTRIDFATNPVPPDFFGPGSDPFDGVVALQSASMDLMIPGPRFIRTEAGVFTGDPAAAVVPAEMDSLLLESTSPIVIGSPMGDALFTVFIRLDVWTGPSTGQLGLVAAPPADSGGVIVRDLPDGDGQVDSFFDITYLIQFREACGCSTRTMSGQIDRVELAADVPFSNDPPAGTMIFDETSNFFPGGDPADLDLPATPLQFDGDRLHLTLALMENPNLPSIMGDANYDLKVDLHDFVILKNNWGVDSGATWAMGDFDLTGSVNLDDFVILKNNWGAVPLPEPTTAALIALGGAVLLGGRRRTQPNG